MVEFEEVVRWQDWGLAFIIGGKKGLLVLTSLSSLLNWIFISALMWHLINRNFFVQNSLISSSVESRTFQRSLTHGLTTDAWTQHCTTQTITHAFTNTSALSHSKKSQMRLSTCITTAQLISSTPCALTHALMETTCACITMMTPSALLTLSLSQESSLSALGSESPSLTTLLRISATMTASSSKEMSQNGLLRTKCAWLVLTTLTQTGAPDPSPLAAIFEMLLRHWVNYWLQPYLRIESIKLRAESTDKCMANRSLLICLFISLMGH